MWRPILISAALVAPVDGALAAEFPEPGSIFRSGLGAPVIDGWTPYGGGYWGGPNPVACCYSIFQRDGSQLVLLTVPITRGPTGGVLTEKIVTAIRLDQQRGENWYSDCSVNGVVTITAFGNPRTRKARGVAVIKGELLTVSGRYDPRECEHGG